MIEDVKFTNEKLDKDFDTSRSVLAQIPFFACKNVIYNKECQDDIARYVYCKDFGVSPYSGSFNNHPAKWIEKAFIIKNAIAKKERDLRNVRQNNNKV